MAERKALDDDNLAKNVADDVDVPFFGSVEDHELFNRLYEKKIQASKPNKRKAKIPIYEPCSSPNQFLQNFSTTEATVKNCDKLSTSSTEYVTKATVETSGEQVPYFQPVVNKEPA